jgi:hypothetical protein
MHVLMRNSSFSAVVAPPPLVPIGKARSVAPLIPPKRRWRGEKPEVTLTPPPATKHASLGDLSKEELTKQQDRQGFMANQSNPREKMYAQAQATIALCELYAMTGDSWIRPIAQASCDFAVDAQSPEGGWRYQPRMDSDTSVTGWFVMGLKSGEAGGLDVDRYVWRKVESYLDSVRSIRGNDDYYAAVGYAYMIGDVATPSMTAEGLLCRQYMGADRNLRGMDQGLRTLVSIHPIDLRRPDVYYWYYATQSLHHYGGPLWTQWNDKLKVALPAEQVKQGREKGSRSPQGDVWGRHAGRLYTTCFSLYCLEVYYRHMPLYDASES